MLLLHCLNYDLKPFECKFTHLTCFALTLFVLFVCLVYFHTQGWIPSGSTVQLHNKIKFNFVLTSNVDYIIEQLGQPGSSGSRYTITTLPPLPIVASHTLPLCHQLRMELFLNLNAWTFLWIRANPAANIETAAVQWVQGIREG